MKRTSGPARRQAQSRSDAPLSYQLRYIITTAVFIVTCITFLVVLAVYQIKGAGSYQKSDVAETKTFVVAGVRGEIYDRNGKKIVGNSTAYDMLYEYGSMPNTYNEINDSLLAALRALGCADALITLGKAHNFAHIRVIRDLGGNDRVVYISNIPFDERSSLL